VCIIRAIKEIQMAPKEIRTRNGTVVEIIHYLGEYSVIKSDDGQEVIESWILNQFDLHEYLLNTKEVQCEKVTS